MIMKIHSHKNINYVHSSFISIIHLMVVAILNWDSFKTTQVLQVFCTMCKT